MVCRFFVNSEAGRLRTMVADVAVDVHYGECSDGEAGEQQQGELAPRERIDGGATQEIIFHDAPAIHSAEDVCEVLLHVCAWQVHQYSRRTGCLRASRLCSVAGDFP